jgi:hypothetical protein
MDIDELGRHVADMSCEISALKLVAAHLVQVAAAKDGNAHAFIRSFFADLEKLVANASGDDLFKRMAAVQAKLDAVMELCLPGGATPGT